MVAVGSPLRRPSACRKRKNERSVDSRRAREVAASSRELARHGFHSAQLIGLAKREETIHRENGTISLSRRSEALKLLQRVREQGAKLSQTLMFFDLEWKAVDDTIAELSRVAQETGWMVPKVYDLQGSLAAKGHTDAGAMKIMSLCQPHHAAQVLALDENKRLASIMPCRFGVYQTSDGKVYISGMNIALMSRMFGSAVAGPIQQAAADEEAMIKTVMR